jgi:hypothetical protein
VDGRGLCRRFFLPAPRQGRVFADHFHSRLLRSPTELVNAIRYVLGNAERHYGETAVDAFSSEANEEVLAAPAGWLLQKGWSQAPKRLVDRLKRWTGYQPR